MAHPGSDTNGTHYDQGIPYDEQGNKTDPTGRRIDNFLRDLFGGEGVGGSPTPNLGILPQAPALGSAASGMPLGIQAGPNYGVVGGSEYETDAVPSPTPTVPTPNVVPGSTVGGPGEFGPGVIGADVFEDPNALNPFGRFVAPPPAQAAVTTPKPQPTVATDTPKPQPSVSTTPVSPTPGRVVEPPVEQTSGAERALNVGGRVVDEVLDEFGNVVNRGVNWADEFINRPSPERTDRIADRDAAIKAYNDQYSGNIGTALFNELQRRGGWAGAAGDVAGAAGDYLGKGRDYLIDLFDPDRGKAATATTTATPAAPTTPTPPVAPVQPDILSPGQQDFDRTRPVTSTREPTAFGPGGNSLGPARRFPQVQQAPGVGTTVEVPEGIGEGETGIDAFINQRGLLDMSEMQRRNAMQGIPPELREQIISRIEEMLRPTNIEDDIDIGDDIL
jgi:hypothetical protein